MTIPLRTFLPVGPGPHTSRFLPSLESLCSSAATKTTIRKIAATGFLFISFSFIEFFFSLHFIVAVIIQTSPMSSQQQRSIVLYPKPRGQEPSGNHPQPHIISGQSGGPPHLLDGRHDDMLHRLLHHHNGLDVLWRKDRAVSSHT